MKKIVSLIVLLLINFACTKNEDSSITTSNNYDRTSLLTNWATNIIVPSYENYQSKLQILTTNVASFNASPSVSNLQIVRTSWLEAYKSYQYISIYNFGKAEELYTKETANTYPTNVAGINTNITTGTYNLSLLSQFDKQGFPTVDYLLHGLANTDTQILEYYTTNSLAANYKEYLQVNVNKLKAVADLIVTDWNSGYKASYIANNGNSVTSSVNKTTNNFVKNLEKDIRTGKLGIPAGVFSGGTLFPQKVEGFFRNDISKILLNEAVKASQDFFNGKHFGSAKTGEGLKSYLDFLNAVRNNQKLSDIINNQFTPIYAANNALNNSFVTQVTTDNSKMIAAYDSLQQNVIYTKLDMMQALNISIDYVDGDGD